LRHKEQLMNERVFAVYAQSDNDRDYDPLMSVQMTKENAELFIKQIKARLGGGSYYICERWLGARPKSEEPSIASK
jgi:hypothetical protein